MPCASSGSTPTIFDTSGPSSPSSRFAAPEPCTSVIQRPGVGMPLSQLDHKDSLTLPLRDCTR